MDETSRIVTGLDLGTENVRAVIMRVGKDGGAAVVGYNEGKTAGMRKGVPANLAGPAGSIDKMLGEAERMGGFEVRSAYVSVRFSTLEAICKALNCQPADLLEFVEDKE